MAREIQMLKITKFYMIMVGNWKYKNKGKVFQFLYKLYSNFYILYFISQIVDMIVTIYLFRDCKSRVMELVGYCIQYTNLVIVMLVVRSKKMDRCITSVLNFESYKLKEEPKEYQQIYNSYSILNCKIIIFLIVGLTSVAVFWYYSTLRYVISSWQ